MCYNKSPFKFSTSTFPSTNIFFDSFWVHSTTDTLDFWSVKAIFRQKWSIGQIAVISKYLVIKICFGIIASVTVDNITTNNMLDLIFFGKAFILLQTHWRLSLDSKMLGRGFFVAYTHQRTSDLPIFPFALKKTRKKQDFAFCYLAFLTRDFLK